jgi:phosphoglycolate phosphatase-like HAD superfamily hydrolase
MDKLALFDIDGTLTKGTKAHKAAFSKAFKKVYGVDTSVDVINTYGMTDQQIMIEVLKENGLDEQSIKSKLKECVKATLEFFNDAIDTDQIIVLDGVKGLLEELHKRNVLIGLVTGNLEPIAWSKMKRVGLDHYFKLGGFGSDDINRTNLVKIAIKRAEQNFDFKFDDNVFLFGDTLKDVQAGRKAGVKTIGVATTIYSTEQLKQSGADFVLDNLKDKEKVLGIIL